jgi:uncharacterized protein (TIGR03437 family)
MSLATIALANFAIAGGTIQASPDTIKYRAQAGKYEGASQVLQISFSPLNPSEYFSISKSDAWIVLAGAPSQPACVCDTWKIAVYPEAVWLGQRQPGTYVGTITVTASGYTSATVRVEVEVVSVVPPPPPTAPTIGAVVNAASFLGWRIGWGSLITIFGERLASGIAQADRLPLPKTLGGVQLFARDELLELLYVSPTQINARMSTAGWNSDPWTIRVVTANGSAETKINYTYWDPGIFTAGFDCPYGSTDVPCGLSPVRLHQAQIQRAIVTDSNWALVTRDNAARLGRPYSLWLTGLGYPGYEGDLRFKFAQLAVKLRRVPVEQDYRIAAEANVLWAGAAPGLAGLYQINFELPRAIVPSCGEKKMEVWLEVWLNLDTSNVLSTPLYVSASENPCVP